MSNGIKHRFLKSLSMLMVLLFIMCVFPAAQNVWADEPEAIEAMAEESASPAETHPESKDDFTQEGNVFLFSSGETLLKIELCTAQTVRVQLSLSGGNGFRPASAEYYMVQKNDWPAVSHEVRQQEGRVSIFTQAMEIRVDTQPLRVGMYDLEGILISRDTQDTGMYWQGDTVGVRKEENPQQAGGIFGFGSGDHGRRDNLNRYNQDFSEFSMSHGRVLSPFFMSSVGYGIFLNTIEKDTVFFKHAGGFETKGYLDYFFMYGPEFKDILSQYAEITGHMELFGKWAHGFMLSKYGNDNATQHEFSQWINRLRQEGYPADSYVFDYGWRGDTADNGGNQTGAGEKWGRQMWSNDRTKFPDISAMFREAKNLGFRVGLHNNAGTPEASGGKELHLPEKAEPWVRSYMDSVITTGYGDWFWPDEFDVLGSNTAPVFSSKGAYEAWKEYTVESRPMFMTRGGFAGHHYATVWSGDINNTSQEIASQIGFGIDAGLIGYWASSNDLGGFMSKPTDALYTRWTAEFGAWSSMMRTHGHGGREPWLYNKTAQDTLRKNLKLRYRLYPYIYSSAWQGYSKGIPIMRAMLLEDGSRQNPDAWDKNKQYYFGDWFLVAPATDESDTVVPVWLPPGTTWYDYNTKSRYEGGENGRTIQVGAALEDIPVFVKSGAIIPMGPDLNYADEHPLDPLTLDIYPGGTSSYTLFEDDGLSRRYITKNAYSTTEFTCIEQSGKLRFQIKERQNHNPQEFKPSQRSYNLQFHFFESAREVTQNGSALAKAENMQQYNDMEQAFWVDTHNSILYVKIKDTGLAAEIEIDSDGFVLPGLGEDNHDLPPVKISDETLIELEQAEMIPAQGGEVKLDKEWKGYTGEGYAKGFKAVDDSLRFKANVVRSGQYTLAVRVNCGKKNTPQYDSKPRSAALYIDGDKKLELAFQVTEKWGDSSKNGDWRIYNTDAIILNAGKHVFEIKAEGENPGNFNLDSLTFTRKDTSLPAFVPIGAEKAAEFSGAELLEQDGEGLVLHAKEDGAWAQFNEVSGENKAGISMRVKSTGGSIVVYENGIGDKILAVIPLPKDNTWQNINLPCKNTDAPTSTIFLQIRGTDGKKADCSIGWFRFVRGINAYSRYFANSAEELENISKHPSGYLSSIGNGSGFQYKDLDFGTGGVKTLCVNTEPSGTKGKLEVFADSVHPQNKIAEMDFETTSSGLFETIPIFCKPVTGVHTVHFRFSAEGTGSICDFMWFEFTKNEITVQGKQEGKLRPLKLNLHDRMAKPGTKTEFSLSGWQEKHKIKVLEVRDAKGALLDLETRQSGNRYAFVVPQAFPATVFLETERNFPSIEEGALVELEYGEGDTNGAGALRIDTEWAGYTGSGYVAGWKQKGNYTDLELSIGQKGVYALSLKAAAGPKGGNYDSTARTGAIYIDGIKTASFSVPIQNSWGNWVNVEIPDIPLTKAEHTLRIVSEGEHNPGNFNLDSVSFRCVQPQEIRAAGVEVTPRQLELQAGGKAQLQAHIFPANAADVSVHWSSSRPEVAQVSQDGTVHAVSAGSAEIIASTNDGGFTAACRVSVQAAKPDSSPPFSAPSQSGNSPKPVSSAPSAPVGSSSGGAEPATQVQSVQVNMRSRYLKPGATVRLRATIRPAHTKKRIVWKSSKPQIATVSTSGKVIAKKQGTAIISAQAGEKKAKVIIRVAGKYTSVRKIKLDKKSVTLRRNKSIRLKATVYPEKSSSKKIIWSSSNPRVAKVSSAGSVRAVSKGRATITATSYDGGYKVSCRVTVSEGTKATVQEVPSGL